jgi:regulator of RNase E activity RraB
MKQKYFYTTDVDFHINADADIHYVEAESYEEAEKLMLDIFKESYDISVRDNLEVIEGQFSDCWIKSYSDNFVRITEIHGIQGVPCTVQYPGTHPGGSAYWITPSVTVYVPSLIKFNDGDSDE